MNELLLLALFFAHFLGDFTKLSTDKMLEAKRTGDVYGIQSHAYTHAVLTSSIVLMFTASLSSWILSFLIQFVCHYAIDYSKFELTNDTNNHPAQRGFWLLFGLDQFAHAATIILIFTLIT